MRTTKATLLVIATAALTGCSASAPLIAVMKDDLFTGKATGYPDRTGTIEMASTSDGSVKCMGSFAYTGERSGSGTVTCNDGVVTQFQFTALSMMKGYGMGTSPRGPMSFTYGLSPEQASQYLQMPRGKTL